MTGSAALASADVHRLYGAEMCGEADDIPRGERAYEHLLSLAIDAMTEARRRWPDLEVPKRWIEVWDRLYQLHAADDTRDARPSQHALSELLRNGILPEPGHYDGLSPKSVHRSVVAMRRAGILRTMARYLRRAADREVRRLSNVYELCVSKLPGVRARYRQLLAAQEAKALTTRAANFARNLAAAGDRAGSTKAASNMLPPVSAERCVWCERVHGLHAEDCPGAAEQRATGPP